MSPDVWIARHPYLEPLADFHARVSAVANSVKIECPSVPNWDHYADDYQRGIPLLESSQAAIDREPAERVVVSLVEKLTSVPLPERTARECRDLNAQMHAGQDAPHRAIGWLLGDDVFTPAHPGLLRYLGWTALAQYLRPIVKAFTNWREEERWLRCYCPTCGSGPSMAQLVGTEPGRQRLLSCGCCRTRWQCRRIWCPFCGSRDTDRLCVLAIAGEPDLRIDYCESCRAYLKTYNGEGSETLLLADWTSLHLDLIANERGLKRLAPSLYDLS
jgi:FdhE protein